MKIVTMLMLTLSDNRRRSDGEKEEISPYGARISVILHNPFAGSISFFSQQ